MPPVPDAEIVPVDVPKHLALLEFKIALSNGGWFMVANVVALHPKKSVMVQLYVPGARFVAVATVCDGAVVHE